MNVNLHIDSIVLDGIQMGPGQDRVLQQVVSQQLSTMLREQPRMSPFGNDGRTAGSDSTIHLGHNRGATSLGSQLANAIYTNIPQSHFGLQATNGGQS